MMNVIFFFFPLCRLLLFMKRVSECDCSTIGVRYLYT